MLFRSEQIESKNNPFLFCSVQLQQRPRRAQLVPKHRPSPRTPGPPRRRRAAPYRRKTTWLAARCPSLSIFSSVSPLFLPPLISISPSFLQPPCPAPTRQHRRRSPSPSLRWDLAAELLHANGLLRPRSDLSPFSPFATGSTEVRCCSHGSSSGRAAAA